MNPSQFLSAKPKRERGQGLVEYALILALVAIVVIVALALVGSTLREVYGDVLCTLHFGRVSRVGHELNADGEPVLDPEQGLEDANCYFMVNDTWTPA